MSYSWGNDTSTNYSGGGYSYDSAKKAYNPSKGYNKPKTKVKSSFASSSGGGSRTYLSTNYDNSPKDKTVTTDSEHPIVITLDLTGSMGSWRDTFIEKMPLLWTEKEGVTKYFQDAELSIAAIGDGPMGDYRALQVCEFKKGSDLDEMVASLSKQGGGGNEKESYDLATYYFLNKCEMPKAKKPLMFIAGDEGFYETTNAGQVKKWIGDTIENKLDTKVVMEQLKNKFDVYILRKEYGGYNETKIDNQWKEVFGEKVIMLEDPKRIVDTILGIVAMNAGEFDNYSKLLGTRQTKKQVGQVMKSVMHLSSQYDQKQLDKGKTVLKLPSGKLSKKLG